MNPHKRQKLSDDEEDDSVHGSSGSEDVGSPSDSEDEIHALKPQKSQHTKKRKIRASRPSAFADTLQSLLKTETPTVLPLSLKPSLGRRRNDEKLELKAKKVLQIEKKELEDKGRIQDIIGGWGGERERALRKVAQRGVVQLFNAVQQSQITTSIAVEKTKRERGTGKASLPAPTIEGKPKKGQKAANVLGRAKTVEKNEFFDMIRAGGVVSST
ncbi:Rrp15p-domain-containing protein [Mycena floridula]|nr:Rrp15p-domain-containing protein [Mycena floridula]